MRPYPLPLLAAGLLCLSVSRCASPLPASGPASLTIVAYNVKSLFDARDDGAEFPEFSVSKGRWDDARYRTRLANVGAAVLAASPSWDSSPGPDLLCLEEIENARVLEALRAGPLAKCRYRYAAIAPAEGGPFSVCALSRLPILSARSHGAATPAGRAGRDVLELELDAGGRRLVALVCHWKSKSGGVEATEEARREDAALVRGRVAELTAADPDVELVVCGDFNESPDEYLREGRRYPTGLMPVEEAQAARMDPGRTIAADRLLVASRASLAGTFEGEPVLYSPWDEAGGYSYSFRGRRERLDGFLLSPGLLDAAGLSFASFAAASASFLVDAAGAPLDWPGTGSSGYSDHLPILLRLVSNS